MMREAKQSKWKVGDLVTLSAAGRSVKQNEGLWELVGVYAKRTLGYGVVIGFHSRYATWPVQVKWFSASEIRNCNFKDYELKKFK
jgi:hypothetical protein